MKSERSILGVILVFLVCFCSFSCVSAENLLFEQPINKTEESFEEYNKTESDESDNKKDEDDEDADNIDDEEDDRDEYFSNLIIKAISAGGKDNEGELIELMRLSEEPILLTDISIEYENSNGKIYSIYEFSDDVEMIGESLLLRLKSSEKSEESDLTYAKDLSQSGGKISLIFNNETIDSVCWGEIEGCEIEKFNSKKPTTLVRNLETFTFAHVENYEPVWEENRVVLKTPEEEPVEDDPTEDANEEILEPICADLEFTEIFTYFESGKTKQFIEFFNAGAEKVTLDGCYLEYKTKIYQLSGEINSGQYYAFYPDFSLTKNPTESNTIILHDIDDSEIDQLTYLNGQKKDASYAKFFGEDGTTEIWAQTFSITPGAENIYQQYRSCEEGKIINEETGRCIFANDEDDESDEEREVILPVCRGLQFSEILSFYETEKSEQFIEFYNPTSEQINLNGCKIRYKNRLYALDGIVHAEEYFLYLPTAFSLTKNPTSSNKIEIIDADDSVVDTLIYYNGQKKAVSYAQFGTNKDGSEIWEQTYSPTPGEENNFQRYKTCEAGKVINEETGNCVKITSITTALAECPAGSYRNPLTNRCKKYSTTTSSSTLKECAEGYERNPETNRCRKIVQNDGEDYEIQTEDFEEKSSFTAIWAIIIVAGLGAIYIVFEFRKEIAKLFKKKKN